MNYQTQFNKLTQAYIRDVIFPYDQCACFVGNLLNNNGEWAEQRDYTNNGNRCDPKGFYCTDLIQEILEKESNSFYTIEEIDLIENLFLKTYQDNGGIRNGFYSPINEDALFLAFEVTLDLLKSIHEAKGEIVDAPEFKKRELQLV